MGDWDTVGHVPLDTVIGVLDMSGRPFKHYFDLWKPDGQPPVGDKNDWKRQQFLLALRDKHPDRTVMSNKQFGRWMNGQNMMTSIVKPCADVLIGTDPSRAVEHQRFIDCYGKKSSQGQRSAATQPAPTNDRTARPASRKMLFPRLFSYSVEIPSQSLTAHDPAASVTLLVDMKHATEPVEGLSFHAEIALKSVVFTVDCDTCQPKVNRERMKDPDAAPRGLGVPANGVAFVATGESFNGQQLVRELMVLQPLSAHTVHTAAVAAETDYDSLVPIVPGNGAPSKSKSVLGAFLKQAKFKRYDKLPLGKVEYPWGDAT